MAHPHGGHPPKRRGVSTSWLETWGEPYAAAAQVTDLYGTARAP
ncbi:hypothetical protein [Streptomyces levis]